MKSIKLVACSAGLLLSAGSMAATQTNTMTNIATVVGGCDIVAIGANFGLIQSPMAGPDTSFVANTSTGNTGAANPDHAGLNADGNSPDDDISLVTGVGLIDAALTPLVSGLLTLNPGVFVACTATPGDITLESGANTATLSKADLATTAFSSAMTHTNATDTLPYDLTFTTAVVDTTGVPLISAFLASFQVLPGGGNVPVATDPVAGDYTDVVTATVNF